MAVLAGGWDEHVTLYRDDDAGEPVGERIAAAGELPLLGELRAVVSRLSGGLPPKSSAPDGAALVARIAELKQLAPT